MGKYGWRDNSIKTDKIIVEGKMPIKYSIAAKVATSTAAIMSAENINANGSAAYAQSAFLINMPYPMRVTVTANVAGTAGATDTLTFAGYDAAGNAISEALEVSTTAGSSNTSSYAFSYITSMTPNTTSKSTSVGIGYDATKVGLPYPCEQTSDIYSIQVAGVQATTSPLNAVTNDKYNVASGNFSNAGDALEFTYLTKLQLKDR